MYFISMHYALSVRAAILPQQQGTSIPGSQENVKMLKRSSTKKKKIVCAHIYSCSVSINIAVCFDGNCKCKCKMSSLNSHFSSFQLYLYNPILHTEGSKGLHRHKNTLKNEVTYIVKQAFKQTSKSSQIHAQRHAQRHTNRLIKINHT